MVALFARLKLRCCRRPFFYIASFAIATLLFVADRRSLLTIGNELLASQSLIDWCNNGGAQPFYTPSKHHLDCEAYFNGDTSAVNASTAVPASMNDSDYFYMALGNCTTIKQRYYYAEPMPSECRNRPASIAYAINAFRGLEYTELMLNAIYSPNNYYCIHIDTKASAEFILGMTVIASCFDNILFPEETGPVDSGGKGTPRAYFACAQRLLESPDWTHMIAIQVDNTCFSINI